MAAAKTPLDLAARQRDYEKATAEAAAAFEAQRVKTAKLKALRLAREAELGAHTPGPAPAELVTRPRQIPKARRARTQS